MPQIIYFSFRISTTDGLEYHIFFNSRRLKCQSQSHYALGRKTGLGSWKRSLAPGGFVPQEALASFSAVCTLFLADWLGLGGLHVFTTHLTPSPTQDEVVLPGASGEVVPAFVVWRKKAPASSQESLSDFESYLEVLHLEDPEETSLFIDYLEQGSQLRPLGQILACYLLL